MEARAQEAQDQATAELQVSMQQLEQRHREEELQHEARLSEQQQAMQSLREELEEVQGHLRATQTSLGICWPPCSPVQLLCGVGQRPVPCMKTDKPAEALLPAFHIPSNMLCHYTTAWSAAGGGLTSAVSNKARLVQGCTCHALTGCEGKHSLAGRAAIAIRLMR